MFWPGRLVSGVVGTALLVVPCSATAAPVIQPFNFTGAEQTWVVPDGVVSAEFTVLGASGGDGSSIASAGLGGSARAPLGLAPGESVSVFVGGVGGNSTFLPRLGGFNGGGDGRSGAGGGATDIRLGGNGLADRVLVAGGGGGTGFSGFLGSGPDGGHGGGLTGDDAHGSCAHAGSGGTQTAGGAANDPVSRGSFGNGGREHPTNFGGGGGGGWFGGGGGDNACSGGGGGSGHGPPGTVYATGVNGGNGSAQITYVVLDVTTTGSGTGYVDALPDSIDCGRNDASRTSCTGGYAPGTEVTLKAHPADGTDFAGWSGDCTPVVSRPGECKATMDDAKAVTASFVLERKRLTVVPHGSGSGFVDATPSGIDCGQNASGHATCAHDYDSGTTVTLTAHPDATSDFTGFTGAGCSGTATTCSVTLDQARSVSAGFALKQSAPAPTAPDPQVVTVQTPADASTAPGPQVVTVQTPADAPPAPKPPKLVVSHRRTLLKDGRALIELRCKGVAGQTCSGTIQLRSATARQRARAADSGPKIRFSIAAQKRRTLAVPVSARTKAALARSGKAVAQALIAPSDGAPLRLELMLVEPRA